MLRLLFLKCYLLFTIVLSANTILVKNITELNEANKKALPGDIIILQNGEWKDVTIKLSCSGTKDQPILFKAQTPGKVLITGNSKLKLGGDFIVVDGFYFLGGYSGKDAVINFRIDKDQLANNCRVTNCAINNFNNPKRLDENYWIAFYGKNNRLDHCSFIDKKNLGVLLAVVLDDERSRENFHSIDHNYFGRRVPLASNGGEIIRVGVSEHSQYNSNTRIANNFFEHCNGETEVISNKSCSNRIEENVFKECQGSVVLRHGDNNLVARNLFLGNDQPSTGGVRVINKGQKVIGNIFYKCRGIDFRSPMAIMNGIPNSPAYRYVQVINAEIANNKFYECSPISLCEGSDTERTLPPDNVIFARNTFYNTKDSAIYKAYDDIKGFHFEKNTVNNAVRQKLPDGFEKGVLPEKGHPSTPPLVEEEVFSSSGASWFAKNPVAKQAKAMVVNCSDATAVYKQLKKNVPVEIVLTSKDYVFYEPAIISVNTKFRTTQKGYIDMHTVPGMLSLFMIKENASLNLQGLRIDGDDMKATHFVSSDSSGGPGHYSFTMRQCSLINFSRNLGCENIFYAFRSSVADKITIEKCSFDNNKTDGFILNNEKEDKGYYNVEKMNLTLNSFSNHDGVLIDIYRGGNDESTLGPDLTLTENSFSDCSSNDQPLINLMGVQKTNIFLNTFNQCNEQKIVLQYKDWVRARHLLTRNILVQSGAIRSDRFVIEENNKIN